MADPNWPKKRGIQCHVTSCSVLSGGAGQGEVNRGLGARRASGSEEIALRVPLISTFFFYQYYCCYCLLPLLFC